MGSISSVAKDKSRPGWWRARYRDPDGRERSKRFRTERGAKAWLEQQRTAVVKGDYVDPRAAKRTFRGYAEEWQALQAHHRGTTAAQLQTHLARHVHPVIGHRPIGALRRTELQAFVNQLANELAPSTVRTIATWCSTILRAAVDDGVIARTPWSKIKLPPKDRHQVVPITAEQLAIVTGALPDRYRALATVGATTGLRQGELLGLTVDRVDFLRKQLRVDRQLVTPATGDPHFGPPKSKASVRVVPLPQVTIDALAAHIATFPPGDDGLVFTTSDGRPVRRNRASEMWRTAADTAGLPPRTGMHALRHFYASVLIRGGESVKVVQSRLGHASPVETLEIYAGLWPDDDDRTRSVIDAAFRAVDRSIAVV